MSDIRAGFIEVDRIARRRRRLRKGIAAVLCQVLRGRMGWDLFKAGPEFRTKNQWLIAKAEELISDRQLSCFLEQQKIRL